MFFQSLNHVDFYLKQQFSIHYIVPSPSTILVTTIFCYYQAAKVIDHVRCNHSREFKRTNKDMDLFRKKMISMPRNIMSFTCKQCRIVFHGDVKIAIVHLVLEHGQNVPQRNDFVFQCRICGPRALFDNERQLESHCKMHLDEVNFTILQFHNSSL